MKNGLRGGFPIKINGYALGSQENLQDVGREGSSDRMDIFGPRVRSRQNSVSRQSSVSRNLECDQQEGGLYSSTPFGPLQGKVSVVSGSKLKSSSNSHHISRATNNLTNQKYSSNTVSVCKTEQASSLLNLSLIGSPEEDRFSSKIAESKERQQQSIHSNAEQDVTATRIESNVARQSELVINNNNDVTALFGSRNSLNGTYESMAMSQPQSLPFMFQRPKAFHKKSGSFGSQINLASRNASTERSLKDFSENSSCQVYNNSEIFSQEIKSENLTITEHSSESVSHLHNQGFNEIVSEQETCQNQNISEDISQINNFSTESVQIDSEVSENRASVSEVKEATYEQPQYSNSDSYPEHYSAQCRYETSQNTADTMDTMDTESQDIKEFNIEAKIVIRPSNCEIQNYASSSLKCESEAVDQTSRQEGKQQFIKELESLSNVEEIQEMEQESEIGKNCFINPQQKDMINSCIEELEKLAEFHHDQDPPNEIEKYISVSAQNARHEEELEEYEEVQFSTEEIIDSDDLEHIHVVNSKSEQRRLSSQFENIQLNEVVEVHSALDETQDEIYTSEKEDYLAPRGIFQDFEEKINQTVERREIITTTERMEDFEETINQISERVERESHQFEETKTQTAEMQESVVTSKIQEVEETETKTSEIEEGFATTGNIREDFEETKSETVERQTSIFLTEMEESERAQSKVQNKRERNRTIDYHSLPSLYWEASVQNYHERQYVETEQEKTEPDDQLTEDDKGRIDLAKDGLSLILKKLQEIESKLDNLPKKPSQAQENPSVGATQTPEPRRLSLPGRFTSSSLPDLTAGLENLRSKCEAEGGVEIESLGPESGLSSNCSTPTLMEIKNLRKEAGYESDSTVLQDSDCEAIIDEKSETEDRESYRAFNLNIMEISDLESSEDEDAEERTRRIEQMAAAMNLMNTESSTRRAELNMDIDTLSERSEDETEKLETKQPKSRSRRPSGRVRSMSRERSVAKIRYCWRCHKAGHENWQCREDVQPGGWCPRCLETSHWEDECWVEASAVTCPVCNLPGHLPCIHQATDFRQRKLVIDTFGWLPFKEWFQDLTFRSWWNCSGYTGVPLYKILQRNPEQDLDLGFDETEGKLNN